MKRLLLIGALALAACDAGTNSSEIEVRWSGEPQFMAQPLAPANLPAFFDCLRESGHTIVSAHRGGPTPGFAENAIPTFENTVRNGQAFLEIDIGQTRDGALVLMHDDEVDRTTTGTGRVRDLTLAQLQALQLEDDNGQALDAHPPSLREALDWADGRTVLELDVKRGVSYEDVAREVEAAGAMNRVIFVTYSVDGAARLARVARQAMIYTTLESADDLDALEARGVNLAHIIAWTGADEPNSALNVALAQRGVEARFGTLGGRDSWDARFAREGQDQYAAFAETGITIIATDRPAEASRDLAANDGVDGVAAMRCATAR